MPAKIFSAAVVGLEAVPVEVEADIGGGEMGIFNVVGLPDAAISESRERVRSAVKNSQFDFPRLKITVNLAPANLKKHGPIYDLPIALSVVTAMGKGGWLSEALSDSWFVGELALDGTLRPVAGILPIACQAKELGIKKLFVPKANAREAAVINDLQIFGLKDFKQLGNHLSGRSPLIPEPLTDWCFTGHSGDLDFKNIAGQNHAKRALTLAAAGGHNILMSGSPGSGKTLLARSLPSILPALSLTEAVELTKVYSVAGVLSERQYLVEKRPFRAPHHSSSAVAIIGGGSWPRPGEVSLAHRGVLFLDEFGEFPRQILEGLRQPLEDGVVTVSRATGSLTFPAKFMLVAAMNPCPCGFLYDQEKPCRCTAAQLANYKRKLSGPILDRIDLYLDVPRLSFQELNATENNQSSAVIRQAVEQARARQTRRFVGTPFISNHEMTSEIARRFCVLDIDSRRLLEQAIERLCLSPRSYFKVIKLARTIADLADQDAISSAHVAEALQYRPPANVVS